MDGPDRSGRTTVRPGLVAGLVIWRVLRQAEREDQERLPAELRRPRGRWLETGDTPRSVRLGGTALREDQLRAIFEIVREDDETDVVICGWLALREDDDGLERVGVLIGSYLIGHLDESDGLALRRFARRRRRGRAAWVDACITHEDSGYVVDVNLPPV